MDAPPDLCIRAALKAARQSPCAKSRRGVAVFRTVAGGVAIYGVGFNSMPGDATCDGSETCRAMCSKRCVHAEMRAIRAAAIRHLTPLSGCYAVHVKLGTVGELVAGGGPSCWQCSREVLDVNLGSMWLYEQAHPNPPVGLTLPPATWRRYTAAQFHAATLAACDLEGK